MLPNGDNQHQRSKFNEFFNRWRPEDPLNVVGRVHWAPKRSRWSQMCLLGHSRTTDLLATIAAGLLAPLRDFEASATPGPTGLGRDGGRVDRRGRTRSGGYGSRRGDL